jgi:hypothetical protein
MPLDSPAARLAEARRALREAQQPLAAGCQLPAHQPVGTVGARHAAS